MPMPQSMDSPKLIPLFGAGSELMGPSHFPLLCTMIHIVGAVPLVHFVYDVINLPSSVS